MKTIITFLAFFIYSFTLLGQVGINTANPESSAVLDLDSNDKGLLIPRLSMNEIVLITNPAEGLLVHCTNLNIFCLYTGGEWTSLRPWKQIADDSGSAHNITANIPDGGNVGIGYDVPVSNLAVNGNLAVGGNKQASDNGAYFNGKVFIGSGTPNQAVDQQLEVQGQINVTGNINTVDKIQEDGHDLLPAGSIIMWSGSTAPAGWTLCDGSNGSPNLSGKFIMGFGSHQEQTLEYNGIISYATSNPSLGSTGGYDKTGISVAQMPAHDHSGSSGSAGTHSHDFRIDTDDGGGEQYDTHLMIRANGNCTDCYFDGIANTMGAGNHSHTITVNSKGSNQAHENRPPYYVLAFIMKL